MSFSWRYLLRLALGLVFLYAAVAKIPEAGAFAREIHNYRLLPVPLENVFALGLAWTELLLGLGLVLNLAPRTMTLGTGLLLVVFFIAIGQAVIRDLDIECGCFGTSDASHVGLVALGRDIVFLALAFFGYPRGGRTT